MTSFPHGVFLRQHQLWNITSTGQWSNNYILESAWNQICSTHPSFLFPENTKTRDLHYLFTRNLMKLNIIRNLSCNSFIVIRARHHKTKPYQRQLKCPYIWNLERDYVLDEGEGGDRWWQNLHNGWNKTTDQKTLKFTILKCSGYTLNLHCINVFFQVTDIFFIFLGRTVWISITQVLNKVCSCSCET